MAYIRATCPDCGDVELTSREVSVRVCSNNNFGTYVFHCPACAMPVVKSAEPRIVELLAASGVRVTAWSLPLELLERDVSAPPINEDDLIDFHRALEAL